jgi:hypothetical protein
VVSVICPDVVFGGTLVPTCVVPVTLLVTALVALNTIRSFETAVSKFVPAIDTADPTDPIVGVKLVIVGTPLAVPMVKVAPLVAEPLGVVTETVPVVAPLGTLVKMQ